MINIVIFGPPGAGKGTQSERLQKEFDLVHISTGDMFRAHIKGATELGVRAKSFMEKGELVPDSLTISMLKDKVLQHPNAAGFIFDGFPRTIPQAGALDEMLRELKTEITVCLSMDVPEDELVTRLISRGKSSGRADDSSEAVIRNRLNVYQRETAPLKTYYADRNKLREVNGVGTIEEIFHRLGSAVSLIE